MQGKESIFFSDPLWEPRLAYLVNVFDQLKLNLKLQGKDQTVIHFVDSLRAFIAKIQNWVRKINAGNFAMFQNICEVVEGEKELDPCFQNEIINHLQNLGQEFTGYFPDLESIDLSFIADPFNIEPDSVPDPDQDEYLEMKIDSGVKCLQKELSVKEIWAQKDEVEGCDGGRCFTGDL
ncbi:zinc finger BED domain-containing protein 5-like [Macrobrachium rosenbergii]|uniref:zinc finger BED domain-containing protein 5-like n=1 Tax=Macrobrachium rosenbergii TaxID=79674 RepID=UPI0034D61D6A